MQRVFGFWSNFRLFPLIFLFAAALGVLFSLTALMGLFLGAVAVDLQALLATQLIGLPVTLLATVVYMSRLNAVAGHSSLWLEVWHRTPRWLWVAFALVLSLVLLAGLALFLVQSLSGQTPTWDYYIPIISGSVYALSFCCLYAYWDYHNSDLSGM